MHCGILHNIREGMLINFNKIVLSIAMNEMIWTFLMVKNKKEHHLSPNVFFFLLLFIFSYEI